MNFKDYMDGIAVFGALGSLMNYLPTVAAFLAIVWTCIRIYEWMRVRVFHKTHDIDL